MTYMLGGRQYIAVTVQREDVPALISLALEQLLIRHGA